MLELNDLLTLMKIVEVESLTRAGRALGVPKSTVSRRLARLEEQLGAQLIRRTTHHVTPTQQGILFYEYCQRCIGVLREGERAIRNQHRDPRGLLRIILPRELDRRVLAPLITDYLDTYPDVRLVSVVANDQAELLRDGFDVAIVAGDLPLAESSYVASRLGSADYGIYASPSYVERKGMPQSHVDLARFDLLAWGEDDFRAVWQLRRGAQSISVEFKPRMVSDDPILLHEAVRSGLGIALLPAYLCENDVASGRMIVVLPGWRAPAVQFYAVFPKHQAVPPHARALIDHLTAHLRPALASVERAT